LLLGAAAIYGKRINASIETTNYAAEVRLRAERRLGEMLAMAPKAKGTAGAGRPKKGGPKTEPPNGSPTLSSIGISKKESARAQDLATFWQTKEASEVEHLFCKPLVISSNLITGSLHG
jgi:hypothetical protein